MNPIVKEKWMAALRSGEYKQGKGVLRSVDDEFCCLGVLTDLRLKEQGKDWTAPEEGSGRYQDGSGQASFPSAATQNWAGIEGCWGDYADYSGSLVSDNDSLGRTFLEIADIIEANF